MTAIHAIHTPTTLERAIEEKLCERMKSRPNPMPTAAESVDRARRAVRKVDQMGERGTTLVTMQEIEAMALILVVLGLRPYDTPKGD